MYVFGVVVSDSDETPVGRASAALKAELPSLFPEHGFEFLGPQDGEGEEYQLTRSRWHAVFISQFGALTIAATRSGSDQLCPRR